MMKDVKKAIVKIQISANQLRIKNVNPFVFCVKSISSSLNYVSSLYFRCFLEKTTAKNVHLENVRCIIIQSMCSRMYSKNVRGKINCIFNWFSFTYRLSAQSKNLCKPFSSSLIWNQFDLNAIMYGALFCS